MLAQKEIVLRHLKEHGSITSWEAVMEYGILRLPARISDLRNDGYDIETHNETKKKGESVKHYARYELKK